MALPDDDDEELVCGAVVGLIDEYIALGEMDRARALIHRLVDYIGPPQGPAKAAFLGAFGGYLIRAGDPEGGRVLIERARQAALALPDPKARAFTLPILAGDLFEAGRVDEALAIFREMEPQAQTAAIRRMMSELASDPTGPAFDLSGIILNIGDPWLVPKDPARAAPPCRRSPLPPARRATSGYKPASWRASPTSRAEPETSPAPWRRPGRSPN